MLYLIHLGRHYICCILYTQAGITQVVFYTYRLALHRLYFIHISWHYICCILYTQARIIYAVFYKLRQTLICCITYAVFYKLRQALHMLYLINLGRHYICCILYTQAGITQVVFLHILALHRLYFIHIARIIYAVFYTLRQTLHMLYHIHLGVIIYAVVYTHR